jgi:hypothetical protein
VVSPTTFDLSRLKFLRRRESPTHDCPQHPQLYFLHFLGSESVVKRLKELLVCLITTETVVMVKHRLSLTVGLLGAVQEALMAKAR